MSYTHVNDLLVQIPRRSEPRSLNKLIYDFLVHVLRVTPFLTPSTRSTTQHVFSDQVGGQECSNPDRGIICLLGDG